MRDEGGAVLDRLDLRLGIVGPDSQAQFVQNKWHQTIHAGTGRGWRYQLKDEPALQLEYDRKWRLTQPLGPFAVEAIPTAGAMLGNVYTLAGAGLTLRFGQNTGFDYGPPRLAPSFSGSDWFDPAPIRHRFGWYLFAGAQGRIVAHNIFLDGNTYRHSPSVDRELLVGDLELGGTLAWSGWIRASFAWTWRSNEFETQTTPDRFSAIAATLRLWF